MIDGSTTRCHVDLCRVIIDVRVCAFFFRLYKDIVFLIMDCGVRNRC